MSSINKMSAEELAMKANESIGDISSTDKRHSQITKRRILDFTTKGLLMKPFKDGNKNYYTDEHLKQLIVLRELQIKTGVSDKTMLLAITESKAPSENDLQKEALDILSSFNQSSNSDLLDSSDTSSKRILKSIGTEYVASSSKLGVTGSAFINQKSTGPNLNYVQAQNIVGSNNVKASSLRSLGQDKKDDDFCFQQEFILENNQRNERAKILNQLRNTNISNETVYEVMPGMKIVVSNFLEIKDEKVLRDFIEKFIQGYKKVTDGS